MLRIRPAVVSQSHSAAPARRRRRRRYCWCDAQICLFDRRAMLSAHSSVSDSQPLSPRLELSTAAPKQRRRHRQLDLGAPIAGCRSAIAALGQLESLRLARLCDANTLLPALPVGPALRQLTAHSLRARRSAELILIIIFLIFVLFRGQQLEEEEDDDQEQKTNRTQPDRRWLIVRQLIPFTPDRSRARVAFF